MARPTTHKIHPRILILNLLKHENKPMTAYEILDALRDKGIKAPPTIYRALDDLITQGLIHKIKENNKFLACNDACVEQNMAIITICSDCETIREIEDKSIYHHINHLQETGIIFGQNAVIELPIICKDCSI